MRARTCPCCGGAHGLEYLCQAPPLQPGGAAIVAVLGPPAAGKSTLARPLARELGVALVGIDDERRPYQSGQLAWAGLLRRVDAAERLVVVESCIAPRVYAERLRVRTSVVLEVTAPEALRASRLATRGWRPELIHHALRRDHPAHDQRVQADMTIDHSALSGAEVECFAEGLATSLMEQELASVAPATAT